MYRMNLVSLISIIANITCLLSIFSAWLYILSTPSGYPPRTELIATADLFYTAHDPAYRFLLALPLGLVSGFTVSVLSLTPRRNKMKYLMVLLTLLTLILVAVPNFVFGSIFEQRRSFTAGSEASFSVAAGPASGLASLASALYFITLVAIVLAD